MLSNLELIADLFLLFSILATFIIFFFLGISEKQIIFIAILSIASPIISYPIDEYPNIVYKLFPNVFLGGDRVQIKDFIVFNFVLLLFLKFLVKKTFFKNKFSILTTICFSLFFMKTFLFDYGGYSLLQSIVDLSSLLGGFLILIYFRGKEWNRFEINRLTKNTKSLLTVFIFIVLLDVFVSFTGIIPWAKSYRGGIQGSLTGIEMPFSFLCAVTISYICFSFIKNTFLKVMFFILGSFVIFRTNVDAGLFSLVLTSAVLVGKKRSLYGPSSLLTLSLILICYFYFNFEDFTSIKILSSTFDRIGTYIAASSVLLDGKIFSGIAPGVTSVFSTNLGNEIFSIGYEQFLVNVSDVFSKGVLERANYISGGQFIPHNSGLALVASHGVLLLVPAIYYYYFVPLKIIANNKLKMSKNIIITSTFILCTFAFSLFHPLINFISIVYFSELFRIQSRLDNYIKKNEY